ELGGRGPKQGLRIRCGRESLLVFSQQEARSDFENPVPADHGAHPVFGKLRFEGPFVELGLAEDGHSLVLTPNGRDEVLLADDEICTIPEADLPGEINKPFGLLPDLVQSYSLQNESHDNLRGAAACKKNVACLDSLVKSRP